MIHYSHSEIVVQPQRAVPSSGGFANYSHSEIVVQPQHIRLVS